MVRGDLKMKKNKIYKICAILIFVALTATSTAQSFSADSKISKLKINITKSPFIDNLINLISKVSNTKQSKDIDFIINPSPNNLGDGPNWEDDFDDESWIDIQKSSNYIIDTDRGIVEMDGTISTWFNSDWSSVKEITITNDGDDDFDQYVLELSPVYYESDMQEDFRDIRFTDEEGTKLDYWIGEKTDGENANVLVRVPEILANSDTTIYMFYGNPDAEDESDFAKIFTWAQRTSGDIVLSYKSSIEGAWDPDVAYGGSRFLVAFEEGRGPEDIPELERQIHGRTYDINGGDPQPPISADEDIYISGPADIYNYHAENPSIASNGNGIFFVAWEQYPIPGFPLLGRDIKGAIVTSSGSVTKRFDICTIDKGQHDPCVAYGSGRFFVAWEDARYDFYNYNVYGKIFDTSGNAVSGEIQIDISSNYQGEPWVCYGNGNFLVVYETGADPQDGPFSLKAKRFTSSGGSTGGTIDVIDATATEDYIFPSATYCPNTERFFIAWNSGNPNGDGNSLSRLNGRIMGQILDKSGNVILVNGEKTIVVQPGDGYIRTDVVPYLDNMFFVSFDQSSNVWGVLVSSDGRRQTGAAALGDGSSMLMDWNNLAVGGGNIFSVWEDERDQVSGNADSFGRVLYVKKSGGSDDVSYNIGEQKELITEAYIVTKPIEATDNFKKWDEFDADFTEPNGHIEFDILSENGNSVLISNVVPGEDISGLNTNTIRLKATFTRDVPDDSPELDKWSLTWVGEDNDPPWTEYEMDPSDGPNGQNGWYTMPVEFYLYSYDDVSTRNEITTYFTTSDNPSRIETYRALTNRPRISVEGSNNWVEFWSVDEAENEETHNTISNIKIDRSPPSVRISDPQWGVTYPEGEILVRGDITETTSGIDDVQIRVNGFDSSNFNENPVLLSEDKTTFEWNFGAENWNSYNIEVFADDKAGHSGSASVGIICSIESIENSVTIIPGSTEINQIIPIIPGNNGDTEEPEEEPQEPEETTENEETENINQVLIIIGNPGTTGGESIPIIGGENNPLQETTGEGIPVAVIQGPATARLGQTVFFDGSESYDTDGEIVRWDWNIKNVWYEDIGPYPPSVQFWSFLTQTVRLKVYDNDGNTHTTCFSVKIQLF